MTRVRGYVRGSKCSDNKHTNCYVVFDDAPMLVKVKCSNCNQIHYNNNLYSYSRLNLTKEAEK